MDSSRQDLFIDMVIDVIDRYIFKNNQIKLSPCSTFIPKTGEGLPKTGGSFYCVVRKGEGVHAKRISSEIHCYFIE